MGALDIITGGGVTYRVRIFDNGIYIKSVKVPNKGQLHFPVTVHAKMAGFGEKTRMEFMLNPKIHPHIFNGNIFEVDFDIRDAVQLGDLLDIDPTLVFEINKKYLDDVKKKQPQVINADITVNEENKVDDSLLEEEKPAEEKKESEEEVEDEKRPIDTVIETAKTASDIAGIALPYLPVIRKFQTEKTQEDVTKVLALCAKSEAHRKLLYWVPARMNIEPEIHQIVSQTVIYNTGISPSYYKAQSDAPIAEKMMSRPKEARGWQDVVMLALVVLAIIVALLIATGHI
jgi:hypothetical protein